jgi:hypothetical protein
MNVLRMYTAIAIQLISVGWLGPKSLSNLSWDVTESEHGYGPAVGTGATYRPGWVTTAGVVIGPKGGGGGLGKGCRLP